jgi:hypothetical protein
MSVFASARAKESRLSINWLMWTDSVDEVTGKLMQLRFVPSENTSSYFDCLRGYLDAHGCPVAFYSDKHSVFLEVNPLFRNVIVPPVRNHTIRMGLMTMSERDRSGSKY